MNAEQILLKAASERILVLDGAMGTMIQAYKLDEAGYRGARFDAWNREVRGNNDLLNLSQPKAVRDIHLAYFRAGADIVSTNTFSSTAIAQADYGMQEIAYELNYEGARLVRAAAITAENEDGRNLRQRLDHQHCGHQGRAGEMPLKEILAHGHVFHRHEPVPRFVLNDRVDQIRRVSIIDAPEQRLKV